MAYFDSLTATSLLVQQQFSFEDTRAKNVELISSGGGRGQFNSFCVLFLRWHGKAATVTYQRLASLSNK